MNRLLEAKAISVKYGQIVALSGIGMHVDRGEAVALVGANGAGKSTLIKTIVGLLRPAAGALRYDGTDIADIKAHRRARVGIGYAPEGRRIFPGLSVRENLEVASFSNKAETGRLVDEMYEVFPILADKDTSLGWTLSGGQQQMLAVSRALMSKPRLLLLDEPSLGLSPKFTDQVLSRVPKIAAAGTAVILAEQNLSKALDVTDRAYVLRTGSIIMEGRSEDLRADPTIRSSFLGGL